MAIELQAKIVKGNKLEEVNFAGQLFNQDEFQPVPRGMNNSGTDLWEEARTYPYFEFKEFDPAAEAAAKAKAKAEEKPKPKEKEK